MGCQDSAQERHCAVYHYVISVEAGGIDVQVSFLAHLRPTLLLKPMTNSPWLFPVFFLTPCSRKTWLSGALSAPGHYHSLEDGIQPFHVMAIWFPEQGMDTTHPAPVHTPPEAFQHKQGGTLMFQMSSERWGSNDLLEFMVELYWGSSTHPIHKVVGKADCKQANAELLLNLERTILWVKHSFTLYYKQLIVYSCARLWMRWHHSGHPGNEIKKMDGRWVRQVLVMPLEQTEEKILRKVKGNTCLGLKHSLTCLLIFLKPKENVRLCLSWRMSEFPTEVWIFCMTSTTSQESTGLFVQQWIGMLYNMPSEFVL